MQKKMLSKTTNWFYVMKYKTRLQKNINERIKTSQNDDIFYIQPTKY